MYKLLVQFFFCIMIFSVANSQNGCAIFKPRFYDTVNNKFVLSRYQRDTKKWFKGDSTLIVEVPGVHILTDEFGKETFSTLVDKYIFIDLKNRLFYEYKSFSDTATLIAKYFQPDSVKGWTFNFWVYNPFNKLENTYPISDTVMNGVLYKRFAENKLLSDSVTKNDRSIYTYYLNCSEKNTFFTLFKKLTEVTGCPVLYTTWYWPDRNQTIASEIEHVSNRLTKKELKVFAAWEKNAREHPVQE